ncbi:MAG TPA: energy transducer TonB [Pyrinomonadaceae bacterium]|nr:energy transducer TonB [Pyrinomonadaceae bacterium]
MFNNLIESSSHRSELRRRGSFFLFTTATYVLLFAIASVVSIHAYDAQLEDQSLEIVTLLPPIAAAPPGRESVAERPNNPRNNDRRQAFDERRIAMAPIDRFEKPPEAISTQPNPDLPVRVGMDTLITGRNYNAEPGVSVDPGTDGVRSSTNSGRIITEVEPPPAPVQKPLPRLISKGVITSQAISLPKPPYPPMAKLMKIEGVVSVQVLIDESGKVISAKAMAGNPALVREAEKAALQARFSPTLLGDQPVKVSGTITYNFRLQN